MSSFLVAELTALRQAREELFRRTRGLMLSVPALLELNRLVNGDATLDEVHAALAALDPHIMTEAA